MSKSQLREGQMNGSVVVAQAQRIARDLVATESRGPGDTENAMRRLEARYGLPFSTLWALRYRSPKDLLASTWENLKRAHEAECERQMRRYQHELEIARAKAGAGSPLLRAAARLAGVEDGEMTGSE